MSNKGHLFLNINVKYIEFHTIFNLNPGLEPLDHSRVNPMVRDQK